MAAPFSPEHRRFVEEAVTTRNGSETEVHLYRPVVHTSAWQFYVPHH